MHIDIPSVSAQFSEDDMEKLACCMVDKLKPLFSNNLSASASEDKWDIPRVAQYIGVSPSWVKEAVRSRKIPFFKIGKYIRFSKKDIDRWLENQKVKPV